VVSQNPSIRLHTTTGVFSDDSSESTNSRILAHCSEHHIRPEASSLCSLYSSNTSFLIEFDPNSFGKIRRPPGTPLERGRPTLPQLCPTRAVDSRLSYYILNPIRDSSKRRAHHCEYCPSLTPRRQLPFHATARPYDRQTYRKVRSRGP